MSSEQDRREIHLEKERVPKMTSHFESLSEKVNEGERQGRDRTVPRTVGKFEMNVGENEGGGDEEKRTGPSLEEISKFREKAQQNSVDAIKAAEKRYQKVAKESAAPREESETTYAKEKAAQAKDYTFQKAVQAKDAAVSGGGTAAHYVGEKAAAAQDVSLEAGKGAAGYAGKKAAELKDKALATGWGVAHYATGKAVEATKAAAGAIQSSAEYTDEKVVDYTGRKRAAAQQDLAAKESYGTMVLFTNYTSIEIECVLFYSIPLSIIFQHMIIHHGLSLIYHL